MNTTTEPATMIHANPLEERTPLDPLHHAREIGDYVLKRMTCAGILPNDFVRPTADEMARWINEGLRRATPHHSFEELSTSFPHEAHLRQIIARDLEGLIVGTVSYKVDDGVIEFTRLFVCEHRRRMGLGSSLVEKVAARGREAGCGSLTCSVHEKNVSAQLFYRRIGMFPVYAFDGPEILFARQLPTITAR